MSQTNAASQQYLKNAVMTARPEQLQVMLIDGALRFAQRGREAIEAKNFESVFENLDRAQRICLQLSSGLNRDVNPELADQMIAVYDFCYRRLIDACLSRTVEGIDDAVRILKHQRETWEIIVEKLAKARETGEAADLSDVQLATPAPQSVSPTRTEAAPATPARPAGTKGSRRPALYVSDGDQPGGSINFEG